jgi:DNA primase
VAFPPGFLHELRGRISLSSLVGRRVKLQRRGREFAGLCPFHNEKTASFYVVEDKNFFHCFGCGAHGDAIGFVMRADNVDFLEAVEKLAGEAGLAVPQSTPEEREKARRQKTLLETLEAAAAHYEMQLWSPVGREARDYLRARALDDDTIRRFRLGWAPDPRQSGDRQSLRRALAADYGEPLLVEAGLLYRPEAGEPFDYFRNRVMFPIGDRAGRVIAFGGRVLGDDQPKYLNTPDSPVFEKGRVLYGWSAARAASAEGRDAIVTEGYIDVIALHRAGFSSAVAPLGTALTEFQLHELWRLGPEPILCFDGDLAGQRAAARALRRALPLLRPGRSLRFATLPAGEDPDSLIRSAGREAFEQILRAERPLSRMLWEVERRASLLDTPERRADLDRRLMEHVALITDPAVRNEYRRYLRDRLYEAGRGKRVVANARAGLEFIQVGPTTPRRMSAQPGPMFVSGFVTPPGAPGRSQREALLATLMEMPSLIADFSEPLVALDFPEPELDKLRRHLLEVEATDIGADSAVLQRHMDLNGLTEIVTRLYARFPYRTIRGAKTPEDVKEIKRELQEAVRSLSRSGVDELAAAEQALAGSTTDENWDRLKALKDREALENPTGGRD